MLVGALWARSHLQRSIPSIGELTQISGGLRALQSASQRWFGGRYVTSRYLGGKVAQDRSGFYRYQFEIITGDVAVGVFSDASVAAAQIVSDVLGVLPGRPGPIQFEVSRLVESILAAKHPYRLSHVSALMHSETSGLRRIAFSGMDVGRSDLYSANHHLFSADACGLRDTVSSLEIARIFPNGRLALPGLRTKAERTPGASRSIEHQFAEVILDLLLASFVARDV
jgi:hypothetical protein